MKKSIGIVIGIILIGFGVIYALTALGIADIKFSLDGWWTLFIILPCLNGLFTDKNKTGSLIGITIGVLLLLAARDVFEYNMVWKLGIPIIVVIIGINIIVKAVSAPNGNGRETSDGASKNVTAVFTDQKVDYSNEELTTAKISAVFGGATCNLTNANIVDGSHIDVVCVFGGADIIVPENVTIKNNMFCLFGGVDDKKTARNENTDNITLNINGFCIFGGIDIK